MPKHTGSPEAAGQALVEDRFHRADRDVNKVRCKAHRVREGKAGIAVPSKDKLPGVIDTLISAVRAGELDDHFAQASKQRVMPTARK
jgi:hypothetical protein